MVVAVTGGAGFLGSHMVRRLLKTGNEVRVTDNLSSGSLRNLLDLGVTQDCIIGDLRDLEFARSAVKNCDVVYHFAADIGNVEYLHGSTSRELSALQSNMVIDANVFKACLEAGVERIIYASSVSVYSIRRQLEPGAVFREEDAYRAVDPEGGYGWAKYIAEKQLEMMTNQAVGVARIFHAYGENIYIAPDRSQVIASLIRKAIRYPRERFVVWGDGTQKRCFVFVSDVIDALQKLEEHVKEKGSLTVNVGSQQETSVRE
ncbi:MAG: NAD-dependent epimerase/dehydratase family protein, partial [Candidatus Bathyarchaeota archaeon]|nr:NAD-dependent epimerase/dehydratase family protein [Candidatus Bathyarchaeota archaeon]